MRLGAQKQAGGLARGVVEAALGDAAEVAGIADAGVEGDLVAVHGEGGGWQAQCLDAGPAVRAFDLHYRFLCARSFSLLRRDVFGFDDGGDHVAQELLFGPRQAAGLLELLLQLRGRSALGSCLCGATDQFFNGDR